MRYAIAISSTPPSSRNTFDFYSPRIAFDLSSSLHCSSSNRNAPPCSIRSLHQNSLQTSLILKIPIFSKNPCFTQLPSTHLQQSTMLVATPAAPNPLLLSTCLTVHHHSTTIRTTQSQELSPALCLASTPDYSHITSPPMPSQKQDVEN